MSGRNRYGEFSWGTSGIDYDARGRTRRRPRRQKEAPTTEDLYGAGLALNTADEASEKNPPFDFSVTPEGKIKITTGLDELGKDLAYKVMPELKELLGGLLSAEQKADARIAVREALIDSRIQEVRSLSVREANSQFAPDGTLVIDAEVTPTDTPRPEFESISVPVPPVDSMLATA
jgi:hypothetical protein